jgi:hypothetical protein
VFLSNLPLSGGTICRQANWRLDPALRRACKPDVAEMCKVEDGRGSETGEVYSCLIHNHDDLDPGCKKELGRAVHMAFFIWSPGAVLTAPCDEDVAALCLKKRPNMDAVPGAVGSCLADIVSARGCRGAQWKGGERSSCFVRQQVWVLPALGCRACVKVPALSCRAWVRSGSLPAFSCRAWARTGSG